MSVMGGRVFQNLLTTEGAEFHRVRLEVICEYLDDSSDLGSGGGACRHHGSEYSFAPAADGAGEACRRSAIYSADFLCALGLHRDRVGTVCRALLWVRAGIGGSERAGTIPERIHGRVLVAANLVAGPLLRSRGATRESRAGRDLSGSAGCAGGDPWNCSVKAGEVSESKSAPLPSSDRLLSRKTREGWGTCDLFNQEDANEDDIGARSK